MKTCTICKAFKAIPLFHKQTAMKDGLAAQCKECAKVYQQTYAKINKQKIRIYQQQKYEANKAAILASVKRYAQKNKGKINARNKKHKLGQQQRTPSWLNSLHFKQIETFYIAAIKLTKELGIAFEVDHIVPLHGKNVCGLHVPWNLQVITKTQNIRKSNVFVGLV